MNKNFWKAALIRAIKTFAQAMVAQIGAGSVGIVQFDWVGALSVSAMAAVLSIFTSLAGLPEVQLTETLYALDNDPDEEDEIEEVGDGTEDDEEGGQLWHCLLKNRERNVLNISVLVSTTKPTSKSFRRSI